MSAVPIIRQQGEGEQMWFAGGGVFTFKATAKETGESFVLIEDYVVQGKCTPMHSHPSFDEVIWVLEGELLFDIGGEQTAVGAGGVAIAPRDVPHAFLVTSPTARLLGFLTPGVGEGFYRAAGEPVRSAEDLSRPADFDRLLAAAAASPDIEIHGPPPFAAVAAHAAG